jgi:hypothetical protein
MIHNTSIIERCEKNAKQMVRGFVESGFGHNFESTFTQLPLGLEGSSGHHRVLRYSLGDLSCAVRFEVDAYYRDPAESSEGEDISKSSLVETFNSLQLGAPSLNDNKSQPISARVIPRGTITPQSSTAELKTRAKSSSLVKFLPQLWFGRTAYLIIGCHANGTFQRVNITRVKHQFEDWERKEANQTALRKLVSLISQLRDTVKGTKAKACIAICHRGIKPAALQVFSPKQGMRPLPEDVVQKFWAGSNKANV